MSQVVTIHHDYLFMKECLFKEQDSVNKKVCFQIFTYLLNFSKFCFHKSNTWKEKSIQAPHKQ